MEQQRISFESSGKTITYDELITHIDSLKTVAKLPPVIEEGKYTVVVPYVELRAVLRAVMGE